MRTTIVLLFIVLLFGVGYPSARAQSQCANSVADAVPASPHASVATLVGKFSFETNVTCLVSLILSQSASMDGIQLTLPQLAAAFQQSGSNAGAGGSTNLVAKGATAKVLSAAAEYGGLTQSASNQVVTFSGSLGGLPVVLSQKNLLPVCSPVVVKSCIGLSTINLLNRFSYSVGFKTTQSSPTVTGTAGTSSAQPTTFTADSHTLSSATAKFLIVNGQAPNGKSIANALQKLSAKDTSTSDTSELQKVAAQLSGDCKMDSQQLDRWRVDTKKRLDDAPDVATAGRVWDQSGADFVKALKVACPGNYLSEAQAYAKAFALVNLDDNSFYEALRAAPMLSLEYDYNTPDNQPSNSTARLIAQINKNGFTGSINAAGSFYNSPPSSTIPQAGVVRDFQVSAEAAYNFSKMTSSNLLGDSTASVAYYYQDQTSPAILNVTPSIITGLPSTAGEVFAKRGVIHVAQAKFAFIPRNSRVTVPVSLTWSNRTELVTNPTWRGQIGVSYNFDSLFSGAGK